MTLKHEAARLLFAMTSLMLVVMLTGTNSDLFSSKTLGAKPYPAAKATLSKAQIKLLLPTASSKKFAKEVPAKIMELKTVVPAPTARNSVPTPTALFTVGSVSLSKTKTIAFESSARIPAKKSEKIKLTKTANVATPKLNDTVSDFEQETPFVKKSTLHEVALSAGPVPSYDSRNQLSSNSENRKIAKNLDKMIRHIESRISSNRHL